MVQTEKEYFEEEAHCPVCLNGDFTGGPVDVDGSGAFQVLTCDACGARWYELYTLTGMEIIYNPEEE